jgi:hypothetical protein
MRRVIGRAARVAYAFVVMNLAGIKALAAAVMNREVWR